MGRTIAFGLSVLASIGLAAAHPASAAPPFSDTLCPRAVPKVVAFNEAATSNDAAKIRDAAHGAGDAYRGCAIDRQASDSTAIEPSVNYNKTRAAQFLVVAGRLDAAAGDAKAAAATLHDARALAADVVDWQPQSLSYSASNGSAGNSSSRNSDRNGSRFKSNAQEILTAADQELAKLAGSAPAAQPAPSPKP
jgi:hypothetical protein